MLLFFTGLTMAAFGSPNRAGVMNSLPAQHRGAGSGMNTTFQNSAQVLSIGIFFTLMIVGLMSSLPENLLHGLVAHGVPPAVAEHVAHLSPVSTLFAAFLGYDPVQHLIGAHALAHLPLAQQHVLTGRGFFPGLISAPVPGRAPRRARLRHRGQPDGRCGLVAPGRQVRLLGAGASARRRPASRDQALALSIMPTSTSTPSPLPGRCATDDVSASAIAQVEAG